MEDMPPSQPGGPASRAVVLTELLQLAQLERLLPTAILRADMECGANQGKPALLSTLQGETPFVMQSAKPFKV